MNTISEKIIAHRGESFDFPENTLSAINAAWKRSSRAVEIDIHLTLDNQIVVIHDGHTGRVGDKKLVINKSTLNELKSVDVGLKKSKKFKGECIPTLNEVLDTVPVNSKLIIEVKCGNEIIKPLAEIIRSTKLASHQIELISFNLKLLSSIKKLIPKYKALWLIDLDYYWPHWLLRINPQNIIRKIVDNNLDGVNVWAGKVIDKSFVKTFQDADLLFYVWTVNDVNQAQSLLTYGVDGITTDRAVWLGKQLAATKNYG